MGFTRAASTMCEKGTTVGKGTVYTMRLSSVERQFQDWKGTFPEKKNSLSTGVFLKGK